MNINKYIIFTFFILLIFTSIVFSCSPKAQQKENGKKITVTLKHTILEEAQGFRIDSIGNSCILSIYNPKDTSDLLAKFTLRPQDYTAKLQSNEIRVPCQRIVCLSSTQLAYFFEMDDINNVVAVNSSRHLFNKKMNQRIKSGLVKKVGKEGVFDAELILSLNPDMIFVSPFKSGGYDAIKNLGIPLVPMAAYSEITPLGRAEWIKMVSLFIGKSQKADSIYKHTSSEYHRLKSLCTNVDYRPTVFSGKMKAGTWFVAGGNSFFSHFFRDAGAEYVIKNDKQGAYPLNHETLYNLAHNADYWRLLTSSPKGFNKIMLNNEDKRYADFKAYKTGNILVCNLREIPYREESAVKPHILLADYISHFHPEILPTYKPKYWTKIENN